VSVPAFKLVRALLIVLPLVMFISLSACGPPQDKPAQHVGSATDRRDTTAPGSYGTPNGSDGKDSHAQQSTQTSTETQTPTKSDAH